MKSPAARSPECGIDLGKARLLHVPAVRLQRNLMLEERPRLRPAVLPRPQLALEGPQAPIHLPRAHRPELLDNLAGDPPPPTCPRQPRGQQGLQPQRPRVSGGLPDSPQRAHDHRSIADRRAPAASSPRSLRPTQRPNHRLAVIARHLTHLIQQLALRRPRRVLVAFPHPSQILANCLWSHSDSPHRHPP